MIEPFTLHGVWEDDMAVEVDVPQFQPQQEEICTLLHCSGIDLDEIAGNTPGFDVSSGLETLEEPGEPFAFL